MPCPPPVSLSVGAVEYTFDADGNLHIPPSTSWSQDVSVSHVRSNGYCTGYYRGYCDNTTLTLSSAYWTVTGSSSGVSYNASNVYVCPTCGYHYTGSTATSSIPATITCKHYNKSDYESATGPAILCTDNLTEEYHDASYQVVTAEAKDYYCTCGALRTNSKLYGCSNPKCCYTSMIASAHLPGSQTSSGCGSAYAGSYIPHYWIAFSDCPTHPGHSGYHYVDGNTIIERTQSSDTPKPSWAPSGVSVCFATTRNRKISEVLQSYKYAKCNICGYTTEQLKMDRHKAVTQQTQTISITGLSYRGTVVQSVEFPSSVNGIVVSGNKTSLAYASSNTNVLSVDPNSGAAIVKGIGTTIITVTAAETPEWTASTATTQITVTKGNLKITVLPSPSSINYGQALSASTLTGGTVTNCMSNAVAGLFSWKDSSAYAQNSQAYAVRFIPTDTQNYNY